MQFLERYLTYINAIQLHGASLGIIETIQELVLGALACNICTPDSHNLTSWDRLIEILQRHLIAPWIAKRDLPKADALFERRDERERIQRVGDFLLQS